MEAENEYFSRFKFSLNYFAPIQSNGTFSVFVFAFREFQHFRVIVCALMSVEECLFSENCIFASKKVAFFST